MNIITNECEMATSCIPVVDFSPWCLEDDRPSPSQVNDLAAQIYDAFSSIGFVYLTNHGINQQMLDEVYSKMDLFFALPHDVKCCYAKLGGSDFYGYMEMERESLNPEKPGDLNESYTIFQFNNVIWPDKEVPGFKDTLKQFYHRCFELTSRVLRLMAIGLGMENEYFFSDTHHCKEENMSALRCLHYPPLPQDPGCLKAGQLRCGEHTDYGSITLLFQDNVGGLEVQTRAGQFVHAVPIPGAVLVNIGDMMQRWTADKLVSAKHRVRIPEDEEKKRQIRQSIVFFANPDDNTEIKCTDGSNKYPPIISGDFLRMRINATY